MLSTSAGVARPVRKPRSSSRKTFTAFSIRSSASKRISSLVMVLHPFDRSSIRHQSADGMSGNRAFDVPFPFEVKDQDRQLGLLAQGDGGQVHHAQLVPHHLVIGP